MGAKLIYEYNCKIVRVVDGDTVDVDIDLGFGIWKKKEITIDQQALGMI